MPKCVANCSKGDDHHSLKSLSRHAHRVNSFNVIFGVVALMSVLGNFLICVAICKCHFSRLKTYNILVFNLAVTDMLTGLYKNMAQVSFIHPALSWKTEWYFSNKNLGPSSGACCLLLTYPTSSSDLFRFLPLYICLHRHQVNLQIVVIRDQLLLLSLCCA